MADSEVPPLAVVIPCYRCKDHILAVLTAIPAVVSYIFLVDDACPEGTGRHAEDNCHDPRLSVIYHDMNQGVGGATITGYRAALAARAQIVVKLDGDGQMNPAFIPQLIQPIQQGIADYTKGNRFYALESLAGMPVRRLIGNAGLSFLNKAASGYWSIFDPTNGYTAIHGRILAHLPLHKVARGYLFESDMLFRLSTIRAVVFDVPMDAVYGDEVSNLRIRNVLWPFFGRYCKNFLKRLFYTYFLRDFDLASIGILLGLPLVAFGFIFGLINWIEGALSAEVASAGTVMLASLPLLLGLQLLILAAGSDIQNQPTRPVHPYLQDGPPSHSGDSTQDSTDTRIC